MCLFLLEIRVTYESAPALWYGCSRVTNRLCVFKAPTLKKKRRNKKEIMINTTIHGCALTYQLKYVTKYRDEIKLFKCRDILI